MRKGNENFRNRESSESRRNLCNNIKNLSFSIILKMRMKYFVLLEQIIMKYFPLFFLLFFPPLSPWFSVIFHPRDMRKKVGRRTKQRIKVEEATFPAFLRNINSHYLSSVAPSYQTHPKRMRRIIWKNHLIQFVDLDPELVYLRSFRCHWSGWEKQKL